MRFPGQYYDQETGLHYNYFRTYDPTVGRYVTSDPLGIIGGEDLNTYAYVGNDPINWIDPLGLTRVGPNMDGLPGGGGGGGGSTIPGNRLRPPVIIPDLKPPPSPLPPSRPESPIPVPPDLLPPLLPLPPELLPPDPPPAPGPC